MNLTLHWAKRSLAGLLCLAAMSVVNPILAQQTQTPVQVIDAAAPEAAPSAPVVKPLCDDTHYFVTANAQKFWWYDSNNSLISIDAKLLINDLPDGLYSLVTYNNATGMSAPAYFQLLGNTSTYSGVLTYLYPTFIHKDVTFADADVTFSGNEVYAYGDMHYGSPYGGTVLGPLVSLIKKSRLTLTETHFQAACDKMWKGFELVDVKAVYADNSIIEDSYQGLKDYAFQNPNSGSNIIDIFEITNCQFINNYRAMELANVKDAIIVENHFTSNEAIKAPFDMAHNGYADDERFYTYSGVEVVKPFTYQKFTHNAFDNCLFGVYIHGSGFLNGIIRECTFKDNKIAGIYTEDWLNSIDNCTFSLSFRKETYDMHTNAIPNMHFQVAYNSNNGQPAVYGIIAVGNPTNDIYDNIFEGMDDVSMEYSIGLATKANSTPSVQHNTFSNLWRGLHWTNGAGRTATVQGNTFNANIYGLYLDNDLGGAAQTLNLSCNTFNPNQSVSYTQTGLYVSANTALNNIGGNGSIQQGNPAGNVWPVKAGTVRSQLPATGNVETGWFSPSNWVSINNNGGYFQYWKYNNEFVGSVYQSPSFFLNMVQSPSGTIATTAAHPNGVAQVICEDVFPVSFTPILFPLSRVGNPNAIAGVASGLHQSVSIYPNPARESVKVSCSVGSIIELLSVTGQLLHRQEATSDNVDLSLTAFRTGIYVLKVNGVSHQLSVSH